MSPAAEPSKKEICRTSDQILCAYFQIPFCRRICGFCCWCRDYDPADILSINKNRAPYVKALKQEIRERSQVLPEKERVGLKVVHFGGGTPSLLSAGELSGILGTLAECYGQPLDQIPTIGIEVRPDGLSPGYLRDLRAVGFNRVSIGAQSFDQGILDRIQRNATVADFFSAYGRARTAGFEDVNIDLVYGFPFQSEKQVDEDIRIAMDLAPEHLDIHPWRPVAGPVAKAGTGDFATERARKIRATARIRDALAARGWDNYNHRCYARPGRENMMHLVEATYLLPWLAFGAGVEQYRAPKNESNLARYMENPFTMKEEWVWPVRQHGFDLMFAIQSMIRLLLLPEGIDVPFFNRHNQCDLYSLLDHFREKENMDKARSRFPNLVVNMFEIGRLQILGKIIRWLDSGILRREGDRLAIAEEHRLSTETWVLFMEAC
ncbi:MAG: radical SAM protein [Pseudomonadota bacterium]